MNAPADLFGLVAGALAGAWQALSIARQARGRHGPLAALGRLLLAAAVLVVAARAHHLAGAATGWLVGLVAGGVAAYRRLR